MTENEIVKKNIGLVKSIVRSFNPQNTTEFDEYYSCGLIGLLKAIRIHKPQKGKLTTIAYIVIQREIIRYIRKEKRFVSTYCETSTNDCIDDFLPILTTAEEKLLNLKLKQYTLKEIANRMNWSIGKVDYRMKKMFKKIRVANET